MTYVRHHASVGKSIVLLSWHNMLSSLELKISSVFAVLLMMTLSACGGGGRVDVPSSATSPVAKPDQVIGNTNLVNGLAINNFNNNDTIIYPLPILYGLTNSEVTSVEVQLNGQRYQAPAQNGVFKILVPLQPGSNAMQITTGKTTNPFTLNYRLSDNPKKVKMLVAIPADEEGRFLAEPGVDNSLEAAKQKLIMEALLMQTANAEMMYKAGQSHMTYSMLLDDKGLPVVETLRLSLPKAELLKKSDLELYAYIETAIRNGNFDPNLKYVVTMSFSSYINGQVLALAARGSGFLALFGSLHLHTCPSSVDQINAAFTNTQVIDPATFYDDSNSRKTYWANCATGMGASLHELGHTFDLPHTPTGIMSRGFDNFNRVFMLREPGFDAVITRDKEAGAIWDPASVAILVKSDWFRK